MAKKFLFSNSGYYANQLVSATIEDAAKTNIVLTFSGTVRPFLRSHHQEFTCVGTAKTVDQITVSESGKTVTIRVTVAYANGNTCTLVHNPSATYGNKGATVSTVVTNNVV